MSVQFTVTRIVVGDYEVPVPGGLSELLNASGAWVPKTDSKCSVADDYDTVVEKRNGRIFTIMTKKEGARKQRKYRRSADLLVSGS